MTTQKSTCKALDRSYLASRLRLSWSYGFICFIITLVCMPVPVMMSVHDVLDRYSRNIGLNIEAEIAENLAEGFVYFWIFAFALFAVVGGVIATDFMINRKKAYLYHSMPQKRATHFSHSLLSVALWFVVAVALNIAITLLVFAANGVASAVIIGAFFGAVLRALTYFVLFLSFMSLCATLAGQTISQLSLLVLVNFLPICIYLTVSSIIYYSTDYSSFFEVSKFFTFITPIYRFAMEYDYPYSPLELLVMLAVSVAIFFGAYFIYKYRKIESAGTPVVHAKFGECLKYLVLVPLTFFSGVLFEALGGGDGWLFFGFFFGAFVGFIFINLFLYRNPSKMFSSVRSFGVFLAIFLVFFGIVGYNVFGHDRYVPKAQNVHQVTVATELGSYTFRDDEIVSDIIEYSKAMIEEDSSDRENRTIYRSGWIEIKIDTKLGFTYLKRIPNCNVEKAQEFFAKLYTSQEFFDAHVKRAEALLSEREYKVWVDIPVIGEYSYNVSMDGNTFVRAYLKDVQNPLREQSQYITTVHYRDCVMRVYSADQNVMAFIASELGFDSAQHMLDTFRNFAKSVVKEVTVSISDAYLYDYYELLEKDGYVDGYWTYKDKWSKTYTGDEAYEIYTSLYFSDHYYSYSHSYPSVDPKYSVAVYYEMSHELYNLYIKEFAPVFYEKYLEKDMSYPSYSENNIYNYSSFFIRGEVPEFVLTYFSAFEE